MLNSSDNKLEKLVLQGGIQNSKLIQRKHFIGFEWVVRAPQGNTVKLLARHQCAGVARNELTFP